MKIPYSWLTEILPELPAKLNHDPRNLEPIMAMLGTGIEEIRMSKAPVDGVIFGVVLECDAIPKTHLLALKVDVGNGVPKSIVTGASNARVGIGVAVATPGTVIQGVMLGVRNVQGIESWGMACSPKELELGEYGGGILELPASDAKPGTPLSNLWPADFVLDIEITPNRADALSVLGIARDLLVASNRRPMRISPSGSNWMQNVTRVVLSHAWPKVSPPARVPRGCNVA
jgi:phenylalanyl-tRNA synthetase beta chain